jgi:chromosome segregation ATPase
MSDNPADTPAAPTGDWLDVEHETRFALWAGHGHEGIYGDDGEMQCDECAHGPSFSTEVSDYKRQPLVMLAKHVANSWAREREKVQQQAARIKELEAERDALKGQGYVAEAAVESEHEAYEALTRERDEARGDVVEARKEITTLNVECSALETTVARLTAHVAELEQSHSDIVLGAVIDVAELERERDEARLDLECRDATLHMTVARLGGTVEGRETHRVNFLQRIDELRRTEATVARLTADLEASRRANAAVLDWLTKLEDAAPQKRSTVTISAVKAKIAALAAVEPHAVEGAQGEGK